MRCGSLVINIQYVFYVFFLNSISLTLKLLTVSNTTTKSPPKYGWLTVLFYNL